MDERSAKQDVAPDGKHLLHALDRDITVSEHRYLNLDDLLTAAEAIVLIAETGIDVRLVSPGVMIRIGLDDGLSIEIRIDADALEQLEDEDRVRAFLARLVMSA